MKQRLGNSIYSLFSSCQCKRSICKAFPVNPRLTFSLGKCLINRPLLRRFTSSSNEEDGFSELGPSVDFFTELGPPLVQSAGPPLKLVTEKPEIFKRKAPSMKGKGGRILPAESSPILRNILSGLGTGKASPASSPKLDDPNNISEFTGDTSKKASNLKFSSSISIENVPSIVNLAQLIEAISKYGNISSASMRTLPDGVNCCDVKFENVESSRKAILAGGIAVGKTQLPISPLYVPPETVTFRIKNICRNTTEYKIQSACKSFGVLKGMARAREDVVDALFSSKDESETQRILTRLNSIVLDKAQWSAELLVPENSIPVPSMDDDYKEELRLQITSGIDELKKEASLKRVYAEDLEYLHLAIMHIDDEAANSN
ncbi:hypothetical protein LguiB_000076 [Lonicera macranthoides]